MALIPSLAELALQVDELLLQSGAMKKANHLGMKCLMNQELSLISALQLPHDPDDPYDWSSDSLARERGKCPSAGLTSTQTVFVVAALHDVHCPAVQPVIHVSERGPSKIPRKEWKRYLIEFGAFVRWHAIKKEVLRLGPYAVHWFTLQARRFELILKASPKRKSKVSAGDCGTFEELRRVVGERLKRIERRVIELVCDGNGTCRLADLAVDQAIQWEPPYDDAFNSARRRINGKLNSLGWSLSRHDSKAKINYLGRKRR